MVWDFRVHVKPLSEVYMLLHSTVSGQGSIAHCFKHGTESLVRTKRGEFSDKLCDSQFLTKGAAAVL
jgi:hypothetical protein